MHGNLSHEIKIYTKWNVNVNVLPLSISRLILKSTQSEM